MILSSFCGVLTLQVGMATLAVVYLLISALVIGINAFNYSHDPHDSWPLPIVLLTIFAIIMVITGIIIFSCAYSESRTMCVVALVFLTLLWLYWIILSGLSFMNKPSFARRICHRTRCPETFWIANFQYKKFYDDEVLRNSSAYSLKTVKSKSFYQNTLKNNIRKVRVANIDQSMDLIKQPEDFITQKSLKYASPTEHKMNCIKNCSCAKNNYVYRFLSPVWIFKRKEREISTQRLFNKSSQELSEKDLESTDNIENVQEPKVNEKYFYILGPAFVGAVLFFVGNAMFFGFTTLVVWAFAQEIHSKAPLLVTSFI